MSFLNLSSLSKRVTTSSFFNRFLSSSGRGRIHQELEGLSPVFAASSLREHKDGLDSFKGLLSGYFEDSVSDAMINGRGSFRGFCIPCGYEVDFHIDLSSGGSIVDGKPRPNWRESLVCPACKMNNRQRLIASLILKQLGRSRSKTVYFMEAVTPIFSWGANALKQHNLIGSEYLGHEFESGDVINSIRHENVEAMSLESDSIDLIVSNDVFEHVPHPIKAFQECFRVLRNEGTLMATIPFHSLREQSEVRACIFNGGLKLLKPAEYHGNPVSESGSLVFTDFGWDLIQSAKKVGFNSVTAEVFYSKRIANLGAWGQIIFLFRK